MQGRSQEVIRQYRPVCDQRTYQFFISRPIGPELPAVAVTEDCSRAACPLSDGRAQLATCQPQPNGFPQWAGGGRSHGPGKVFGALASCMTSARRFIDWRSGLLSFDASHWNSSGYISARGHLGGSGNQPNLAARAAKTATWGLRFLILAGTGLILILLLWAARSIRQPNH
jgi:hypothetical protein